MQPDFGSRGVTRPLSAFLRLAMLGCPARRARGQLAAGACAPEPVWDRCADGLRAVVLWAAAPEEHSVFIGWVLRENSGVIGGISRRPRRRYSALRGRYPLPHVVWTPRASRRSCCCVDRFGEGRER